MSSLKVPIKLLIIILWALLSFTLSSYMTSDPNVQTGLSMLMVFAGLWMTEILPLPVTALLVPVTAYFSHTLTSNAAMAPFSSTIIYLFMGGFTLAATLNIHGIDRWLAQRVIGITGGKLWPTLIGFMLVVSFLSMWMSNTSTTAMMLPIALSLVDSRFPRTRTFIVLGTAYAANIGGLATLVGSPPNAIAAAALNLDFLTWLQVGLPSTLLMFPVVLLALWLVCRPDLEKAGIEVSNDQAPMVWTPQAKGTIVLFLLTVCLWIFSRPISQLLGVKGMDAMVAVGVTALAPALGLIKWPELQKRIDWGILLLFGGGLCLSVILSETGTSVWIAREVLGGVAEAPGWVLILTGITLMIFLTELASNTGSAAILVPVMMAVSQEFNPAVTYALVFGVGVAATCAFMLPVATPPNALAYGTGEVSQRQMLKAGMMLNVAAIFLLWQLVTILA